MTFLVLLTAYGASGGNLLAGRQRVTADGLAGGEGCETSPTRSTSDFAGYVRDRGEHQLRIAFYQTLHHAAIPAGQTWVRFIASAPSTGASALGIYMLGNGGQPLSQADPRLMAAEWVKKVPIKD
jgi:hypothetical protein